VKTKTGVIRCYTNTRFAANKLRDYGLLKFTQKEAFKVWTLSLPGVLVAALTLQANGGRVDMRPAVPFSGLHPQILKAVKQVNEFSSLVDYLKCLCEPNTDIFDRLEPILKNADKLLVEYWRVLQNGQMATKQRSQASLDYTRRLEQIPDYSTFMQQLSDAIQIDLLLQKATQRALEFPENPNGDLFS
jgi:hypothetical protein